MEKDRDPFEYRIVPQNGWELLWWVVTDEERVNRYLGHLNLTGAKERLLFLKVFFLNLIPLIFGLTTLLGLLGITITAAMDLPNLTPTDWWEKDFFRVWQEKANLGDRWMLLFEELIVGLAASLAVGLAVGLIVGLTVGLTVGLVVGLVVGLGFGLGFSLLFGLFGSLGFGLLGGILFGLLFGLLGGLKDGLLLSAGSGLLACLLFGLVGGLLFGLVSSLGVSLIYLRHIIQGHYHLSLTNNIYLIWGKVDTSLFIELRLLKQVQAQPAIGLRLADFLWQYRPKQRNLAALLAHAATAQRWKNAAMDLKETELTLPEYEREGFIIPTHWQEQLVETQKSLIAAETTNLIGTRVTLFYDFLTTLVTLHKSTQQVPEKTWRDKLSMTRRINWYHYYTEAIAVWLKVGYEEYSAKQALAALTEPIATNRYQTGGALSPAYNQAVFMSRDDLKDQLSALLYTTQNFSVFFLQGQRRVGKTSLLKFLPHILGRRFELVYLDLQGSIRSVPDFLEKWQRAFVAHFGLKDIPPLPVGDTWAATFEALHPLFSATAQERDVKIILALDEYEELHTHLAKDPEQGAAFLGAVRHFSQHQAQVSLMFVGLRFFSELQAPNWNEYFPQSVPIKVGYLDREKTFQLIEVSTLDFEEGIKEQIYELTQGHPSLIQKIGYELVQIANQSGRRHLTHTDLATALGTMVYIRDNGVTDIFWSQNCELPIDKAIVRAIVEGQPLPPKSRQRLRRLIEYGFIVEEGEGYRMRVPIFEEWVRRFGVE